MNKYIVYVIKSKEGYHYTGMTEDLEKRLSEHNNKSLSFWTKRGNNWKLIYTEEFETKAEVLKREKWLKSGVGREYIKKLGSRFNPPQPKADKCGGLAPLLQTLITKRFEGFFILKLAINLD